MHWRNIGLAACVAALLAPAVAHAQAPPGLVSPEVKKTGTGPTGYEVTIRYYDPTATRVRIKGEWYFSSPSESTAVPATSPGRTPPQWRPGDFPMPFPNALAPNWPVNDLTLDPATGVWSFTTPLPPGTFTYALYRDCTTAPPNLPTCTALSDPLNPPWNAGAGTIERTSQVYLPSDPTFGLVDHSWQAPIAAAGRLEDREYVSPGSTNPAGRHFLGVYTPPGYDATRATPYPLMIIHHGGGGHEAHWTTQGAANRILDNVLAGGRMQPAVVIFPNINSIAGGQTGLTNDLMDNILPFVEANYNVSKQPSDRAVGGLSLGGLRTNELLFNRTTSFGYYGVWSTAGSVPAATSPLWLNPALKNLLGLHTSGGFQDPIIGTTTSLQQRLAANGIAHIVDNFDGGHEWHVWRLNLREFASKVAFRTTTTAVRSVGGDKLEVTVSAATTQPAKPTGTVTLSTGQTAALVDGKAVISVPDSGGATSVTASYRGDDIYNASSGSTPYSADTQPVGGTVAATLSLTLGAPASFGAFTPGITKDYTTTTSANVISTAGDAALSVSEPGHLTNGALTLPQPLGVAFSKSAWTAPASNDAVTITFSQRVNATDALRTGSYAKTLTFTLSTTAP